MTCLPQCQMSRREVLIMKRFTALLAMIILLFSSACAESAAAALQELYAQGERLMVQGDYAGAAAKFEALGTYSDASQMVMYCKAIAAAEMLGLHSMAVDAFNDLGDFKDSKQMAKYYEGRAHEAAGTIDVATASDSALAQALWQLEEAEKVYGGLAFFKDSLTRYAACGERVKGIKEEQNRRAQIERERELARMEGAYQEALTLEQNGDYAEAITLYRSLNGYKDSAERIAICERTILDGKYDAAMALMEAGKYSEAIAAFEAIKNHKDSAEKITECKYANAMALMNAGKYSEAIAAFTEIKTHRDSAVKIKECETAILDGKYDAAVALMNAGKYSEAYDAFIALDGYKDSNAQACDIYEKAKADKLVKATVGSYVFFGSYEQDNNTVNGKENIEWLVLAKENDRLLVISRYALDCKPYHSQYTDVTWARCSLRNWLNTTFLYAAFNSAEQDCIPTVTVSADKNPTYNTSPGNATQDKIFLLSVVEAEKYFADDNVRRCEPTAYTKAQGAYTEMFSQCYWWLRTPGSLKFTTTRTFPSGAVGHVGGPVITDNYAVRPAMWINLAP